MSKKHEPDNFEQMSIFGIMNLLDNTENTLSSDDISKIIDKLSDSFLSDQTILWDSIREVKTLRFPRHVPGRWSATFLTASVTTLTICIR